MAWHNRRGRRPRRRRHGFWTRHTYESSPDPRCRCSRSPWRNRRPSRPSPRTGRDSPPAGRSAGCCAPASPPRVPGSRGSPAGRRALWGAASSPRPSIISGKPVRSATSVTGRPASLQRLVGAPRRDRDRHRARTKRFGEIDDARLVGNGEKRARDAANVGCHGPPNSLRPSCPAMVNGTTVPGVADRRRRRA